MPEFDKGSLRAHILRLSWPMVIANLLLNFVAGFELYLLGSISVETLAAYSIVLSSLLALFYSVHGALINAAMALVSRKCGEKKQHLISEALPGMLLFGMAIFLVYAAAAYALLTPALEFFGAKGEVLVMAREYMCVTLITCLFMNFYSVLLGVARGAGDSITPLKIIAVIAVLNTIFNLVFIVVFKMGIKGAACSNIATYIAGAALYIVAFSRGMHGIKLGPVKWNAGLIKTYAGLTVKSVAQNFTGDIGNMIMLKIISVYGNPFIAAYGIVARLTNFLLMVGWPICNSGGVIVGHNIGGKRKDRAMLAVVESFKVYLWAAAPTALAFFFFSGPIVRAFTNDAATAGYGMRYLAIIAPSMIFMAAGLAAQSAFNGAGSIMMPTALNIASFIVFRMGLALALPVFTPLKENGIFWAVSLSIVFFGAIYWYFYMRGKWLHKEI